VDLPIIYKEPPGPRSGTETLQCLLDLGYDFVRVEYIRTPLQPYLGWEQPSGRQQDANIFSYWLLAFHAWAFQLGVNTNNSDIHGTNLVDLLLSLPDVDLTKDLLLDPTTYKALEGKYLRWLMSWPLLSLAPLKPPHLVSETAP
jgi:hypothetical protein